MRSAWMMGAAAAVMLSMGCEAQKPELSEDFSGLGAADGKSDSISINSSKLKLLGSLDYGQSATATYDGTYKYLAYKFGGQPGDVVTIDVTSKKGDAYAWLTDNSGKILGYNDDYKNTLNSHIVHTLPGNTNPSIITYYIVFKDYYGSKASFTVSLAGKSTAPDYFSCKVDSDCVAEPEGGCCPHGYKDAVNKNQVTAWEKTQQCTTTPHPICPLFLVDDTRLAECNNNTHQCEMVAIDAIQCGGFVVNHHACPAGYDCTGATNPDLPGNCTEHSTEGESCGGVAGIPCSSGLTCVDDPSDGCDPSTGGRDCSGICVDATSATKCGGIAARPCPTGFSCVDDPTDSCDPANHGSDCGGLCVAGTPPSTTCVDTVDCIKGYHWSSVQCTCVSDTCVEKVNCVTTSHWSQQDCTCIPN
jgi:hypothetical protein